MNILSTINFGNHRQLQSARYFLEKCRVAVSLSSELDDFLKDVACCKTETLVTAREKLSTGVKKLSELLEVRQQAVIMASQVDKLIQDTSVLSHSAVTEDKCAFERGLSLLYIENVLQCLSEGNEMLADIVDRSWDYFPAEIQEYLSIEAEQQVRVKDDLEASAEIEQDSEIVETYKASVLHLGNSVFKAIELGRLMPKVRLSELDSRCLINKDQELSCIPENKTEITNSSHSRGYTLEELLEKVTFENSHEATDWGKPVGNEVW